MQANNSTPEFLETVQTAQYSQTINDVTVVGLDQAAQKSTEASQEAATISNLNFTAQDVYETKASQNAAAAGIAQTEQAYMTGETNAENYTNSAIIANVSGNSFSAISQDEHFKAAGLEAAAQTREAVIEVTQSTEFAVTQQIQDLTHADHDQKIREIAGAEQDAKHDAAQNLENDLERTAQMTTSSPMRLG